MDTLLPRYVKWSTTLRKWPFTLISGAEIVPLGALLEYAYVLLRLIH